LTHKVNKGNIMHTFRVATKAVIFDSSEQVLLLYKSDSEDVNPNTVDIPGGRLVFGEEPEDGLKREILEETGLTVSIVAPSRIWTMIKEEKMYQLVGVTFLCVVKNHTEISLSDEHTGAKWATISSVISGEYPDWLKEEIVAAQKVHAKKS
jgi:8-oxo-dGTP diphosphatase